MEVKNNHLILFSAVFLVLGFLLGRVTAHQGPRMHKGHPGCMEVGDEVEVTESMTVGQGQDVQIIRRESGNGEVRVEQEQVVIVVTARGCLPGGVGMRNDELQ